ncbi:hypothetical protein [Marivita sp. S2033]|uniref:hypothetical protein n=1 Tax=Marivita sp. S2033 TaxID=3373187 RepID=UPI0039827943
MGKHMKFGRLAAIIAAAWLSLQPASPVTAETIDLSRIAASPNPRLGLAFPGGETKYYPLIAQAGIGITRLSVQWSLVEPKPGRFSFNGLDSRVAALDRLGIRPFLTFESNADWATVAETRNVKNARPRDPATWERFVRTVVDRYDGDGKNDMPGLNRPVRYWQAANEWISDRNKSGGWIGSADQLIEYIRRTHDVVKATDPNAIFVLGGIAAFNLDVMLVARSGQNFPVRQKWSATSETVLSLEEMRGPQIAEIFDRRVLPVLRQSPYDVADVHLYGPETRDAARISLIRSLTGKPVISSECGGPTLDYGGTYSPEAHFLAVIDRNLGVLATGAGFCLWFRLGEGPGSTYGNRKTPLYTSNARPKPGVFAYRLLSRLIDTGATVKRAGPHLFDIRRSNGESIQIGWNDGAEQARAHASKVGGEAYCLENATKGLLNSSPDRCASNAVVVAGRNLFSIISR